MQPTTFDATMAHLVVAPFKTNDICVDGSSIVVFDCNIRGIVTENSQVKLCYLKNHILRANC